MRHRGRGADAAARFARRRRYVGVKPDRLHLQYEGMNPSGSFKDNGMSAAFSHARFVGANAASLDRQYQRLAGPVLLGDPDDEGRDLHRLGQNLLWQVFPGLDYGA